MAKKIFTFRFLGVTLAVVILGVAGTVLVAHAQEKTLAQGID